VFSGIRLHTLMTRESYINGSIDIQNQFSMESFSYTSTSVEFYNDMYGKTVYSSNFDNAVQFNSTAGVNIGQVAGKSVPADGAVQVTIKYKQGVYPYAVIDLGTRVLIEGDNYFEPFSVYNLGFYNVFKYSNGAIKPGRYISGSFSGIATGDLRITEIAYITDDYEYEIDLLRVDDFDGQRNTYHVVLNGYILFDTQITAGAVFAKVYLDFYDTNGAIVCSSFLDISIKFLSNKTTLTLSTKGGENASFLTQYFSDYGIRLKINELKGAQ